MNPTSKSTKDTASVMAAEFDSAAFSGLYVKGVERVADIQKKVLDVAAQQSAEAIDFYKKALKLFPLLPGTDVFEIAGQSFDRFVETQKSVIELVVEQNAAVVDTAKERGSSTCKVVSDFAKITQQSVERGVALHKNTLEFAAQQMKAVSEAAKQQFGIRACCAGLARSAQNTKNVVLCGR